MTVGQTIYLERHGNAARHRQDIIETKITKIGRKYFDISTMWEHSNFTSNYKAFLSKDELSDELERKTLLTKMRGVFTTHSNPITVQQLRDIDKIISQV